MKILLVYPETPSTFWSFDNVLRFISKKSSEPPLGLITVAALLPDDWEKRLIDMNVTVLNDKDILWADYVFLSGMNIHKDSFRKVVRRCNELSVPVVAGGPMVTLEHREFLGVDHFVLNEAEITLPPFIKDLKEGHPKKVYKTERFPDISDSPVPLWHLLETKRYASMSIQYSRGCPFNCEFCTITNLNGHRPRTKNTAQFIAELRALYNYGWRGGVFVVDDNFIGNKKKLKNDLLPGLIEWLRAHDNPFSFGTETSINLADDDELVSKMVEAGFDHAFIGIETTHDESLQECGKKQNQQRNLLDSVRRLQKSGLRVSAGFILGFDHDPADIFDQMINFIRKSGIVTAMIGLLNAPVGTRLFERLKNENRLLQGYSGNNMDASINFIPKMNYKKLVAGYKYVLQKVYSQKEYYQRLKIFLKEYRPPLNNKSRISRAEISALFKIFWILGIREKGKRYYWKLFFYSLFKYPEKFAVANTMAVYGYHFRQIVATI